MTYIERAFDNLVADGPDALLASSQSSLIFADTLPYKLRGAYSEGTNSGIFIPNLVLNHSFTMTFWIYASDLAQTQTLFSKDTGTYTVTDGENVLDLIVNSDGSLSAELYHSSTNLLNGDVTT